MAKVLYVEDEPPIAALVRDELMDRGHQVVLARNPAAALQAAHAERPAVILLDISLGTAKDDGLGVLLQLKGDPITAAAPVITLTARPDEGYHERSIRGGAFAHLTKPVDFDELAETITRALAQE
jgi:CheY-like chemotaxis protein